MDLPGEPGALLQDGELPALGAEPGGAQGQADEVADATEQGAVRASSSAGRWRGRGPQGTVAASPGEARGAGRGRRGAGPAGARRPPGRRPPELGVEGRLGIAPGRGGGELARPVGPAPGGVERDQGAHRLQGVAEDGHGVERAGERGRQRVEGDELLVAVAELDGALGDPALELAGGGEDGVAGGVDLPAHPLQRGASWPTSSAPWGGTGSSVRPSPSRSAATVRARTGPTRPAGEELGEAERDQAEKPRDREDVDEDLAHAGLDAAGQPRLLGEQVGRRNHRREHPLHPRDRGGEELLVLAADVDRERLRGARVVDRDARRGRRGRGKASGPPTLPNSWPPGLPPASSRLAPLSSSG